MAEWLVEGLTATISGVTTVFVVLILISIIISLLKYVERINIKTYFKKNKQEAKSTVTEFIKIASESVEKVEDDLELVAVITAVIAATMNTTSDQLHVRSIKRIHQPNKAWNRR
jgi:sodium pump decarboxylase gamma subunit